MANTLLKKGINVGAAPNYPVLRLSSDDPCGPIVSKYTVKGRGASMQGNPADGSQVSVKGGFLLMVFAGTASLDPRIPDQVGSLLVLSGRVTFREEDDTATVLKYTGATPIDVCKKLA